MIHNASEVEIPSLQGILEEQFGALIQDNPYIFYIKYEDVEIKGIVSYSLIYDRMEINYIWVKERYRKKGIGGALLKYIDQIAINKRVNNISLEVECTNLAAIGLYRKNGYQIVAKREKYYQGRDGFLMVKEMIR